MQGTNQLVRSNWGLGVLLRDTSTRPGWVRTGDPPTARRQLLPPEPSRPRMRACVCFCVCTHRAAGEGDGRGLPGHAEAGAVVGGEAGGAGDGDGNSGLQDRSGRIIYPRATQHRHRQGHTKFSTQPPSAFRPYVSPIIPLPWM